VNTKKRLILALMLFVFLSCSTTIPVDPEIKKEIKGLETKDYSINEIENKGSYFYIKMEFKHKPSAVEVRAGGLGLCAQVLQVLKKHSVENDICVAVTSPTKVKGQVFFYGFAEYSSVTGEFEWKPYED